VEVEIRNDASEEMTIVFRGPEVRVETIPACTDCEAFRVDATGSEAPPIGRYVLDPGDYDVLVKATDVSRRHSGSIDRTRRSQRTIGCIGGDLHDVRSSLDRALERPATLGIQRDAERLRFDDFEWSGKFRPGTRANRA
jgi:hypothetical protein